MEENIKASGLGKQDGYFTQVALMYNKLALMKEALIYD